MSIPALLTGRLSLPVIGSPMFIVSGPELVIGQCKAGVVGSFPALNARPEPVLDQWLTRIKAELAAFEAETGRKAAPFAVNQICHASNNRLEHDVEMCVKHEVPIVITSLRPPAFVVEAVHSYGGLVFHDVINTRHARKAVDEGVDGLILVCAGAGGHAGALSPLAFVQQTREWYDGTIILSGAIATGRAVLATQAIGADLAYIGTRFINTDEANADAAYKDAIIKSYAEDIVYTNVFSGVHGNYIRASIESAGLDPDNLPVADKSKMNFGSGGNQDKKVWKDIFGGGQGVGLIKDVLPVGDLVARMHREYEAARADLLSVSGPFAG
ncbi:MAG: nitronate monooxygenase [Alphaproteobacteria bacterium]|nr:nitronate monooxygenase [Alphaproteobacteria bacterium]